MSDQAIEHWSVLHSWGWWPLNWLDSQAWVSLRVPRNDWGAGHRQHWSRRLLHGCVRCGASGRLQSRTGPCLCMYAPLLMARASEECKGPIGWQSRRFLTSPESAAMDLLFKISMTPAVASVQERTAVHLVQRSCHSHDEQFSCACMHVCMCVVCLSLPEALSWPEPMHTMAGEPQTTSFLSSGHACLDAAGPAWLASWVLSHEAAWRAWRVCAAAAGAVCVQKEGAMPSAPTRQEVEAVLQEQ